ncbi:hypothetical protein ACVJGC_008132 [Bradyrhizobium diazoefficiens]
MRFIILLALLLPVVANAASFSKADCEFLGLYYATCSFEGNSLPYMGRDEARLMSGHPDAAKRCRGLLHQDKTKVYTEYHRYCRGKSKYIED